MFCPRCGVENPDGANFCRGCGSVLTNAQSPASAQTPAPAAKTSALAITSLVLGILSFCTFFLTAPIAFILGIISLVMITKSRGQLKGTGLAVAGIVIPVVALPFFALLMGIMMPAIAKARFIAQRVVCINNLRQLGISTSMYAEQNNGKFPSPEKWCDLLLENEPNLVKKTFQCPCDKVGPSSYAMNSNAAEAGIKALPDMVLLFESKPGWNQSGGPELVTIGNHLDEGCNVLFCDGHVEFVKTEDIDTLKWTAGP